MFDQAKKLFQMHQEANRIKKELKNIHIEAEDGGVTVTVDAEMEVISVIIPESLLSPEHATKAGEHITKATNKAIKKAQQIAAEKMKGMMGDLQGLMGGGQ